MQLFGISRTHVLTEGEDFGLVTWSPPSTDPEELENPEELGDLPKFILPVHRKPKAFLSLV